MELVERRPPMNCPHDGQRLMLVESLGYGAIRWKEVGAGRRTLSAIFLSWREYCKGAVASYDARL